MSRVQTRRIHKNTSSLLPHHSPLANYLIEIMGNELLLIIGFTIFSLVVTTAWVGGYLDKYQHTLQDILLDKTGENRASYGLKSTFPNNTQNQKIVFHPTSILLIRSLSQPYSLVKNLATKTWTRCRTEWAVGFLDLWGKGAWERALGAR